MSGGVYKVITPVSEEPIALADAKAWLRVDFSDDDAVISGLITRVRGIGETISGRAFATQQIQELYTIDRPTGGELSGPVNRGPNWYKYQEQLGANPFGAAQFYFDLSVAPVQTDQTFLMQTKTTAFDQWATFPQFTNPDGSTNIWIDDTSEPARVYVQDPLTVNFWLFTYWSGYGFGGLPPDLQQAMFDGLAFFYQNREAEDLPPGLLQKFLAKREATAWI